MSEDLSLALQIHKDRLEREKVARYDLTVPDAEKRAETLPVAIAEALAGAWLTSEGWKVSPQAATLLRSRGLVDIKTPHLSAHGSRVRRFLTEME